MGLIINLEAYGHLFKDAESLDEFAKVLECATKDDDTPLVTYKARHIATTLSPEATEQLLSDRILQTFVTKPELLESFVNKLRDLKEEDIVD